MTCIAWDGITLAADKLSLNAGLKRTVTKIRRIDNLLCGGAGDFYELIEVLEWVEQGRKKENYPKRMAEKECDSALLVIEEGVIKMYAHSPYPTIFEDKYFALGSGRDYAITAMYLGKTARESVEIACLFESSCGNGIDELKLDIGIV